MPAIANTASRLLSININENTGPYDSGFQNILERIVAGGDTLPSADILLAQNALYVAEKSFIQSCNQYFVFANGGLNQGATKYNWAEDSNTYNLDYPTAITYNTLGVTGNAVDQYVSLNFNASLHGGVKYTRDSASRGAYVEGVPGAGPIDGLGGNTRNGFRTTNSTGVHKINNSAVLAATIDFSGAGEKTIVRYDANNISGYNAGVKTDTTAASIVMDNGEQFLLRSFTTFSANTISKYFIGPSFTQAQLNSQRLNYAAYRTAIGL